MISVDALSNIVAVEIINLLDNMNFKSNIVYVYQWRSAYRVDVDASVLPIHLSLLQLLKQINTAHRSLQLSAVRICFLRLFVHPRADSAGALQFFSICLFRLRRFCWPLILFYLLLSLSVLLYPVSCYKAMAIKIKTHTHTKYNKHIPLIRNVYHFSI